MVSEPLFGREGTIDLVMRAIVDARKVTITGPGGIGKTRVALAVAARTERAVVVHAAAATDTDMLSSLVVDALSAHDSRPRDELVVQMLRRSAAGTLIVIDNIEQIDGGDELIDTWLAAAPGVRVLVTSRSAVAPDEHQHVIELEPLSFDAGLTLFRARAARLGVSIDVDDDVRSIVTALGGSPLALELAAARTEVLTPREMAERLGDVLALLRSPAPAVARHATLEATIAWSVRLLTAHAQTALARVATFNHCFAVSDAEGVIGVIDGVAPLDLLHVLRRSSLLSRDGSGMSLPHTVRAFILAHVDGSVVAQAVARHADHFAMRAATLVGRVDSDELFDELSGAAGDILKAASALRERQPTPAACATLALAIEPLVAVRGPRRLHDDLTELACRCANTPETKARARFARARARRLHGDVAGARDDLEVVLGANLTDVGLRVDALRLAAVIERHTATTDDELMRARALLEAALAEPCADSFRRGVILDDLGIVEQDLGAFEAARQHHLESLLLHRLCAASGASRPNLVANGRNRRFEGIVLGHLGLVAHQTGDLEDALKHYDAAVVLHEAQHDDRFLAFTHAFKAAALLECGQLAGAGTAAHHALEAAQRAGDPRAMLRALDVAAVVAVAQGMQPADVFVRSASLRATVGPPERCAHNLVRRTLLGERGDDEVVRRGAIEVRLTERMLLALQRRQEVPRLRVAADIRAFSVDDGPQIGLVRRKSLRLLLGALVERHRHAPGSGLTLAELIAVGWPGERVLEAAGKRRVYVAIGELRQLGLQRVLQTTDDGYAIGESIRVEYVNW